MNVCEAIGLDFRDRGSCFADKADDGICWSAREGAEVLVLGLLVECMVCRG
jgi:hypothetical protein